jgi:hypothetical protein
MTNKILKLSTACAALLTAGTLSVHALNVTKLDTTTMNLGAADWSAAPATQYDFRWTPT